MIGTILLIAYGIGALIVGYLNAKWCYTGEHDERPRRPSEIQRGSLGGAILAGIGTGCFWLFIYLGNVAKEKIDARRASGKTPLGHRIFGEPVLSRADRIALEKRRQLAELGREHGTYER